MDIQAFLHVVWVWGLQNPIFWLFVLVAALYVGAYLLLVSGLYGSAAIAPAFATVRFAGFITCFELVTLLVRQLSRFEIFFLAFGYDYVRIFVPDDFLKLASGKINFVVLMIFFTSLIFFSVMHSIAQIIFLKNICGQWRIAAFMLLPIVVLASFTLSFVASGYIYRLIA